jgi:hypothetical protein
MAFSDYAPELVVFPSPYWIGKKFRSLDFGLYHSSFGRPRGVVCGPVLLREFLR